MSHLVNYRARKAVKVQRAIVGASLEDVSSTVGSYFILPIVMGVVWLF